MESVAATRNRLAREDAEFQRLERKHREYESRLEQFRDQRFLTDEEQLEEVRLKKLKLAVKDQMEAMVRRAAAG